ncbi:hypothetical protein A5784_21210 [Mycobacterium sp. 852013-50091_SCH5140682]|uniref:hypothetical protein n=1 Tax=Mycobacterium sp. 852013-50091_SCH5140682 TaxID=1834109 RepID=UPI0007E99B36|nr:hypothetical protein [Mycobacterium sp. 852013-50091_SCH5140682]OBC00053.1 hypothetical protein A5784_21210 [Mycobacterium sp. 852013-50091_SCH5140682]
MLAAILGWLGTVGTFVAYVLVVRGRLIADSWRYGLLNALGGTSGAIAAGLYGAWPSAVSNVIWASVGFVTVAAATKTLFPMPGREKDHGFPAPSPATDVTNGQGGLCAAPADA